ncbi:response regulator transcription factor [soil metagenome]
MTKLRILLADDHTLLRAGLKLLINAKADMKVVGEAGSGEEAVQQTEECRPDVIVMDISMPDLDGSDATKQIKQLHPAIQVLALTCHDDEWHMKRLLRAGANGYALKQNTPENLINAIRIVAAGSTYIDPSLAKHFTAGFVGLSTTQTHSFGPELTNREVQVLSRNAWGESNKEIAWQLGIHVKTVEYHKANAMGKLHLRSRGDILRYALAQGWLQ